MKAGRTRPARIRERLLGGRDVLVLIDTALLSASSVLLLVLAARALPATGLTAFALAQPLVFTAVGIQRATFLSPALIVQRTEGRGWVPLGWIPRLGLPIAAGAALIALPTIGALDGRPWLAAGVVLLAAAAALAQDVVRYRLLSRGQVRGAIASDGVLVASTVALLPVLPLLKDWAVLLAAWAGCAGIAVLVGAVALRRIPSEALPPIRLRAVWRLGRWSGVDSLLGTAAYLLPLFISSLILGSALAGVYRVLQSANGPLNILDTAIATSFGLSAYTLTSAADIGALRCRVGRLALLMAGIAAGYMLFAQVAIVLISGIQSPDLIRVSAIVLIAGMLGALTTPYSAGALALGKQRTGALIRAVVVIVSLLISFGAAFGLPLPWNDPIGTVALFAPLAAGIGWWFSFRSAARQAIAASADKERTE